MKSNISSKVVSFAELMTFGGVKHLLIERYQRPHAWGVEEVEALFQDHFMEIPIRKAAKVQTPDVDFADPFVGSIVLLPRSHAKHGSCMEVIDGQQRTTTLSLLLAMAYRKLVACDGVAPAVVRGVLFADEGCSVPRLVPKEQDKKNYERALSLGRTDKEIESETKELAKQYKSDNPQALGRASFSAHQVISVCLDTYVRRCRSYNIAQSEALLMLIDVIMNGLRIVAVSVDGYSQGMSVFEALNARGQPLTVDQLFKNVLMLTFTEKVQHDDIDEAWEGDRLSFESMVPESSHRDKFLLHYHRAFFGHVQKRMLYASFKKIAQDVKKGGGPQGLKSLDEYLGHFLRNCRFIARNHPPTLKTLGAEVCRPVLMAVREKFGGENEVSAEAVARVSFLFEAALIRIFVCGTGVGRLDSNMATLASDILDGKYGNTPASVEGGVRTFLNSPVIALPEDQLFETKIKSIDTGKLTGRREKLLLARLHQALDLGMTLFWRDEVEISGYNLKKSIDLGNNPSAARLEAAGFSSLPEYDQLSSSLGNVVVTPPGAVKAGAFVINDGLPTSGAVAAQIKACLKKASRASAPYLSRMIQKKYTPILKQFNGSPVMEILRNDQPWNDDLPFAGKMHFSFGVRKARSLLQAEVIIRQYVSSMGSEPRLMDVADLGYVPDTNIRSLKVTMHGPFHNTAGILIDKNYLQLTMDDEQFSFGFTKAQALVGLFSEIKEFVVRFG